MTHCVMSRRLLSLSVCAIVLLVGACSASNGAEGGEPFVISGIGILPEVPPMTSPAGVAAVSVPGSILASPSSEVPQITDNRVFLEGDSVMRGMAIGDPDALDLYVAALGWDLTVDAEVSRFTDVGISNMLARATEIHQVAVVMLGNNYDGDQAAYAAEITTMLESFPDVRRFVMFTVPEHDESIAEVNEVLRLAAAVDDRLVLIDWERMSREIDGVLTSDGVHPTSYGADVLAQAIGVTLGKAPGAGPDVTLPALGSPNRPGLAPGVDTDKGENATGVTPNAPRSTTTTIKPVVTVVTTTSTTTTTTIARAPATTRPVAATPAPTTTRVATTVAGSTTSTAGGATTTILGSSTTAPSGSTSSAPPATTAATTTAVPTTAPPTTTTAAVPTSSTP